MRSGKAVADRVLISPNSRARRSRRMRVELDAATAVGVLHAPSPGVVELLGLQS
jgi:hypothetical protein